MPTYFLTNRLLPISFPSPTSYALSSLVNTSTTITINLAANETQALFFFNPRFYPNNNSSNQSSGNLVLNHTVTNMNINVFFQFQKQDGNYQNGTAGTQQPSQVVATTNTFTSADINLFNPGNCTDILGVVLFYQNTSTMTAQSCTLGTDRSTTYMYSPHPHNAQACRDTARRRIYVVNKK